MKKLFLAALSYMLLIGSTTGIGYVLPIEFDFKNTGTDSPVPGNSYSWTVDGLTITASANTGNKVLNANADSQLYRDNITNPNVGIGVDDTPGGSNEEIEYGESVNFSFSPIVWILGLELSSPSHGTTFPSALNAVINGVEKNAGNNLAFGINQ